MANAPSKQLRRILNVANRIHVALYRKSSGKFAGKMANLPVLLITTFGRKSGKPTTNAVVYIQDGRDYLVSATNGGSSWDPGWYRNLQTRPEAKIEVGDRELGVRATIAESQERIRLYEKFKAASSNFVKYEHGTSRVLPVIRLTPSSL